MSLKKTIIILITLFSFSYADGLMLPVDSDYPKDLLKNRMTHVTVNINGVVAETIVYQEFLNEWHNPVEAVYSFPLPENARATNFFYWHDNKRFKAVLKIKEQATNPGTGEGGIAAYVNKYIGRNGIKIQLKDIPANSVQRVELHYISMCDYYLGKNSYSYPLETKDFITYPYEHLQFSFNIRSKAEITGYSLPGNDDVIEKQHSSKNLQLELIKPKSYVQKDLEFSYQVSQNTLGVDFYSINNDTSSGHFTLFIKPENEVNPDSVLAKRIIFLLSGSMTADKLQESISAITDALDLLSEKDHFNIVIYNYNVTSWQEIPVKATTDNISAAKDYLASLSRTSGWALEDALYECFNQITNDSLDNSILVFSNGNAAIDPRNIESANSFNTGIFPITMGNIDINRARLEMTARLNYGFVTYIDDNDNIHDRILRVYNQISKPILKNTFFEFGNAGVSQVIPLKAQSTYAGSYFFSGRPL
jgi:Ca-activated chloride channel homolog